MRENEGNSAKSINGAELNKRIKSILDKFKQELKIRSYRSEPRYNFPGYTMEQFSPDFEVTLNNGDIIIIDNTTTARHDRFKQKQWDANGVKQHFKEKGINVVYYVVLPDNDEIGNNESREKEIKNYYNEKMKVNESGYYYSMIDDVIQVSDLIKILNG